jgi:hypothetical protein
MNEVKMRNNLSDENNIVNYLRRIQGYKEITSKIKEFIDIEIRHKIILKKIDKLHILQNLIINGKIKFDDNGNIEITPLKKLPLSPTDLQIDENDNISVIITEDEITIIKKDIDDKYKRIKTRLDILLMPPPRSQQIQIKTL